MKLTCSLIGIATGLCFLLPFTIQGAGYQDPPGPGPRDPKPGATSLLNPIVVDAQNGVLTLTFLCDPGEVTILLQDTATDFIVDEQSFDTADQKQIIVDLSAGTYSLIITTTDGDVILEGFVVMP